MFNKIYFLFFLTFCIALNASAQTTQDSIKTVINKMFAAMKESDTLMLKSCFADGAILQTFGRSKEGKKIITTETVTDFCKTLATLPKGAADEQIVFNDLKIDGPMAAVWCPFKLYLNGKFYSCGVNSFQLVKLNGDWKVQYILDTRKPATLCK